MEQLEPSTAGRSVNGTHLFSTQVLENSVTVSYKLKIHLPLT